MGNRRQQAALGAVLALVVFLACVPTATVTETATPSPLPPVPTETPLPPPTLTPIPPPTPTPKSEARLVAVTLRNDSSQTICSVFISPSSSAGWGDDWLEETEAIGPGRDRVFMVEEGRYDLRAEDCAKAEMDTQYGFEVAGFPTWVVSEATTSLTLRNNSGETVCFVYISPSSDTSWGSDWLGASEVVLSGETRVFNVPFDTYDLQAEDCDRNALSTRWSVAVAGPTDWIVYAAAPPPAPTQPPVTTNGTVYLESYTSAGATCRISVWGHGQDFLLDAGPGSPASHVLPPGEYGWQAFFGPSGQTSATAMNLPPGGSCYFACYDEYVEWGCSP